MLVGPTKLLTAVGLSEPHSQSPLSLLLLAILKDKKR